MVTGVTGKGEESDQTDYCSNRDYAEVQRGPGDGAGKGAEDTMRRPVTRVSRAQPMRGRGQRKAQGQVKDQ